MNFHMNGVVGSGNTRLPYLYHDTNYWYIGGVNPPNGTLKGQALSAIISPANKVLVGEYAKTSGYGGVVMFPVLWPNFNQVYYWYPPAQEFDDSQSWGSYARNAAGMRAASNGRHLGGSNVAFADGHVKFMKANEPGFFYAFTGTPNSANTTCAGVTPWCSYTSVEALKFWCPYNDGGA